MFTLRVNVYLEFESIHCILYFKVCLLKSNYENDVSLQ